MKNESNEVIKKNPIYIKDIKKIELKEKEQIDNYKKNSCKKNYVFLNYSHYYL